MTASRGLRTVLPRGSSMADRIALGLPTNPTLFDCWDWQRAVGGVGYGIVSTPDGRVMGAHRAVYELLVGPIPVGLELDHLCRNRRCVNPAHLEAVTRGENIRRGWPYRASRRAFA